MGTEGGSTIENAVLCTKYVTSERDLLGDCSLYLFSDWVLYFLICCRAHALAEDRQKGKGRNNLQG